MDYTARFRFISDALNGTGGFSDGSYLIRYPRESDDKFARRKELAWYRNHLRACCENFVGYLAKRPPLRDTPNPLLQAIIDDADGKGNALDVFWQHFMLDAKGRGTMLLLIDMPRDLPSDRATQINARAVPFMTPIAPETVLDYRLDKRGNFEFIEVEGVWKRSDGKLVPAIYGWDSRAWWIRRGEETLDSGEHSLGVCPVLAFVENGEYPQVGNFAQIADLSKRFYNACSERDEILRAQTFSLLIYQVPPEQAHQFQAGQVAEAIGTHNMLIHGGDAPAFIAPPDGPATIYNNVLAEIEETIKRIALTIEQPAQAESGIARTLRFQQLNSALTTFARAMEDLERRAWWIVGRWLGLRDDAVAMQWAKDYSLADIETELAELQQMQASAFPPAVVAAKQKQIIGLALPNLPPEEAQAMLDSLDAEHSVGTLGQD